MADVKDKDREEIPRRPAEEREDAFNALAWLMEGALGIYGELKHSDLGLSAEFWKHAYGVRRESLLAARTLIDDILARMDQADQKEEDRQQRRERRGEVKIEF